MDHLPAAVTRSLAVAAMLFLATAATAGPLDEMAVERWAKLREAERYQMNVAEKMFREKQYKVAADEYEKFVKLYERSEGAPYAQLKWAHCQVELRKLNTAIKDGYQTVLDYFPDSPEAPIASLLIGRTYRSTGDLKPAKKAYAKTISTYPKHFAAVMARLDLVDIAGKEMDPATQLNLLRELTFDVERKGPTLEPCTAAARQLAKMQFAAGNFEEGLNAFATIYKEANVPEQLMHPQHGGLPQIVAELCASNDEATKKRGEKLADASAGWLKTQATEGLGDEKRKAAAIQTWYYAADIRRAARQPDKQRAIYEDMLKAVGTNDTLLGHIAQWYKDNKQFDAARTTYAKFADPVVGRGLIAASFSEEKDYDKSADLYRALSVEDQKGTAQWLTAAAMAYRHGNKPDQAIAIYRELLTADAAKAADYHFQIAETLYHANRWKECITAYRGTDRFPHNYQNMASAHRHLKEYDDAIALYSQIMATSAPNASWALYQIAATHEQAGRAEKAIETFKQVCSKFPKSQEGSQAHTHLNQKYKIAVTLGGAKD